MGNFDAADAKAIFNALQSYVMALAEFQAVDTHDPLNAPGNRLFCSITLASITPIPASGLASVSARITFHVRIWSSALQRPLDAIDPEVLGAASAVMGAFSDEFTVGGTVRNIDLMGMTAQAVYADFQEKPVRVVEIAVPIIVNDLWAEGA